MLYILDTGDAEMKNENRKTYLFWIALSEAAGALSGLVSRNGIKSFFQSDGTAWLLPAAGGISRCVWHFVCADGFWNGSHSAQWRREMGTEFICCPFGSQFLLAADFL